MKINVGIDLGTTYSAVATFSKEQGKVRILKNSIDKECTPSVVYLENGVTVIGEDAKAEQKSGNVNTVAFYKSMMGDVNYSAFVDGCEYSAEELSGKFLAALVDDIQTTNNVEIGGAVITVPAYFNEKQREATIRAGQKAGLKVLKIINEPTAAIIAYGLTGGAKKNVMVYDLGGGTFDVTIAQVNGTKIDVLATNGNHQLGGKDWDRALLDEIDDRFYADYGVRISSHEDDLKELQVKCEEAKKRLTSVSATTINIMCEGYTGKYEITREFFDERTYSLLFETVMLVESCFDEIGEDTGKTFGWGDIDEVVLVGGSTRMPQVKDMIIKSYGKPPITKDINVDTIVATGAAMQAELCVNQTLTMTVAAPRTSTPGAPAPKPMTLTIANNDIMDVTSHSLGMLALASDGTTYINSIIIKKNSKINETFSKEYTFGGEKLEVFIMQGETRDPYECEIIGKYSITGMPKGNNKIYVNFLYNHNGVVDATANLSNGTGLLASKEEVTETLDDIIARLNRELEEARKPKRIEVMIMIDSSGSMCGTPATQAKEAAKGFVDEFDLSTTYISIVEFADRSAFNCKFSNKSTEIKRAIDKISPGDNVGVCNREAPIGHNYKEFSSKADARIIVVLTDGCWNTRNSEVNSAQSAKSDGIIIYAIGFGTADEEFLRKISSNGAKKVDLSQLKSAFKEVATSIATEVTSGITLR